MNLFDDIPPERLRELDEASRENQAAPARVFLTPVGSQWNNAWVNARPNYEPLDIDVEYVRADTVETFKEQGNDK